MKYLKTYEEQETDEYYNKIIANKNKDITSDEMQELYKKQFEIDDKYKKYKYKYLIAEIYSPYFNSKKIGLIKCLSVFLNSMFIEIYNPNQYGDIKGTYNIYDKTTIDVKLQDITIMNTFNNFKDAEELYINIEKYNI